jgi:very-short-patch-repair endonuclease
MKKARNSNDIQKNASKLHKQILSMLIDIFPNYQIKQEYKVSEINPHFKSNRERYDLVVVEHKLIIEIHGEQHRSPVCFGGIEIQKAKKNFIKRKEIDYLKEKAAREAGWAYIAIHNNVPIPTTEELISMITEAIKDIILPKEEIASNKPKKKINNNNSLSAGPKRKIESRGFQKPKDGYKWPKRKL